jgi:nitrous oxidase accessory protein NosD
VAYNVSSGNGSAGTGLFGPTPGTSARDNLIYGNTLTNNGLPGVAIHVHAGRQNMDGNVIVNNMISGNGGDDDAHIGPTGIAVFSDSSAGATPIAGTVISGNTITGQDNGIWVGTNTTDVSLHFNNVGGNSVGINNGGTGSIDAAWNYWGCAGGPGGTGCANMSGPVSASSWLPAAPSPGN